MDEANFFALDCVYAANPSAAEYYGYKLTVQTDSEVKMVEWVESWASEKAISSGLEEIQLHIEKVIGKMRQTTGTQEEPGAKAIRIAKDFIAQAPTFSFDGIPDSLSCGCEDTRKLSASVCCHINFRFEACRIWE